MKPPVVVDVDNDVGVHVQVDVGFDNDASHFAHMDWGTFMKKTCV